MYENFTEDTIFVAIGFGNESFDLKYFNDDDTELLEEYLSLMQENEGLEVVNYWHGYDVENLRDSENEEGTLYPTQGGISEYTYVLFYDNETKATTLEKIYTDSETEVETPIINSKLEKNKYSGYEYWKGSDIEELEYDEVQEYVNEYKENDEDDDEDDEY